MAFVVAAKNDLVTVPSQRLAGRAVEEVRRRLAPKDDALLPVDGEDAVSGARQQPEELLRSGSLGPLPGPVDARCR
jgi:hypothetical protein